MKNLWRRINKSVVGRFLAQSSIFGLGTALSKLATAILLPFYIVFLQPDQLGIVALSLMVLPVLTSLWTVGFSVGVARFYYQYKPEERAAYVGSHFILLRVLSLVGFLLTLLFGPYVFPFIIRSVPYYPYIYLAVWISFFETFPPLAYSLMRVKQEAHKFVVISFLSFIISLISIIMLVAVFNLGVQGVLMGKLIGSFVSAVLSFFYLLPQISLRFKLAYIKTTRKFVFPLFPELLLGGFVQTFDRFLLDKWVPLSSVGIYSVAKQLGGIAQMVVQSLKTAYTPMIFRVWEEQSDDEEARSHIINMTLWFVLLSSMVTTFVVVFSGEILLILGRLDYLVVLMLLPLIGLANLIMLFYHTLFVPILISKNTKPLTLVFLLYSICFIALALVFTPLWGIFGVLLVPIIANSLKAFLTYWWGEHRDPLFLPWKKIFILIAWSSIILPLGLFLNFNGSFILSLLIKTFLYLLWLFVLIFIAGQPFSGYFLRIVNFVFVRLKRRLFQKKARAVFTFVDVDNLYQRTLFYSQNIRPWNLEQGKYVALELRYDFVLQFLERGEAFDLKKTKYYQYLKSSQERNYSGHYDGNALYSIADADSRCQRFLDLVKLFIKHRSVYSKLNKDNLTSSFLSIYDDIIDFERKNPVNIYYHKTKRRSVSKENKQYQQDVSLLKKTIADRLVGHLIPTAKRDHGELVLLNGSHRLAIFKAFSEHGLLSKMFPVFII